MYRIRVHILRMLFLWLCQTHTELNSENRYLTNVKGSHKSCNLALLLSLWISRFSPLLQMNSLTREQCLNYFDKFFLSRGLERMIHFFWGISSVKEVGPNAHIKHSDSLRENGRREMPRQYMNESAGGLKRSLPI